MDTRTDTHVYSAKQAKLKNKAVTALGKEMLDENQARVVTRGFYKAGSS